MKNIIKLFVDFITYFHTKKILVISDKKKEIFVNFLAYISILIVCLTTLNLLLLLPTFISGFNKNLLLYLLFWDALLIFVIIPIFYLSFKNLERLNNSFLQKSIRKENFIQYLTNDLLFNLKFSLILSVFIVAYLLLLYIPTIFLVNLPFLKILVNFFVTSLALFFIVFLANFLAYLLNRDIDRSFFEFSNYKNGSRAKVVVNVIIFLSLALLSSFALSLFLKNLFFVFGSAVLFSSLTTFLVVIILNKNGFFTKYRLASITEKLNYIFFNRNLKIERYNLFNFIRSINFLYLIVLAILSFGVMILLNHFLNLDIKIVIFQALLFPMFFSKSALTRGYVVKKSFYRAFIFTSTIFVVIFIVSFLKVVNFEPLYQNTFFNAVKPFVNPFFDFYNNFVTVKDAIFGSVFILFYFTTPLVFILTLYFADLFYYIKSKVEAVLDNRIKKRLNYKEDKLLFGDSMSQYYFVFALISNGLLLFVIFLIIKPLTDMIFGFFDIFQIQTIFKLNFLTYDAIFLFFTTIFKIFLFFVILKMILIFFSTLFSHFMLFSNEVVYIENKIYKTSILRIPTSKINYVIIKQNILEKFLDIGTILIEAQDKNGLIKISGISSIKEKNIKIMERIKFDLQKI